jgi:signal transduction histidine kinase
VRVEARRDGDRVLLRVADRGPGVPDGQRQRVFERYVRLNEGGADSAVGGVGLAVVRWVAETHGGDVRLLDGAATCFEVSLPAVLPNAG